MFQLNKFDFFESDDQALHLVRRTPQIPYPLHTHDFSELVIIESGHGVHFTTESSYQVKAGDVFVIQGETSHGYKDNENLNLVNILFNPSKLPLPLLDINFIPGYRALFDLEPQYRQSHQFESRLQLNQREQFKVNNLLEEMEQEYSQKGKGYQFMAASSFLYLVGYLSRCYDRSENTQNKELLRIARSISYIEQNLSSRISLDDLDQISGMSSSTLNRHFKKITGHSPIEYQINLRIMKASSLLKQTDLSITEIAFRVGFEDSNYFTRQFKKIMGISPREYRG